MEATEREFASHAKSATSRGMKAYQFIEGSLASLQQHNAPASRLTSF